MANLYEVMSLENELELIARDNDGEISGEKLKELVEAQTKSLDKIEGLCKYIRNIELYMESCKSEVDRINKLKDRAENKLKSIKKYMTPYVKKQGKLTAGTFKLSTRPSEKVNTDNFDMSDPDNHYYMITQITSQPDKNIIKKDLKSGIDVDGAFLESFDNLQIK